MNPSYIGTVWLFGGNFAPVNFAFCDGQLQPISENEALFTLIGTTYGGDGQSTFGLPDLRGRVVIGTGQGPSQPNYVQGQMSGTETVTLTTSNMASHTHSLSAGTNATLQAPVANSSFINTVMNGQTATNFFSDQAANATLIGGSIASAGSSSPIEIMQPVNTISYIIALFGIFPSQN